MSTSNIIKSLIIMCQNEIMTHFETLYTKELLKIPPDQAMRLCKKVVSKKKKETKPQIVLPFCNIVDKDKCMAMRKNHGLYTQCYNKKFGENYCSVCKEAAENSPTDKPPHGDIRNRSKMKEEGRLIGLLPYANIMIKLNISKKRAISEANTFGLVIPEEEFIEKKIKRGRPKKMKKLSNVVSDTDSDGETNKKKRGRPKKEREKEVTETDMIALLASMC
jgi:hypothetical protein